MSEAILNSEEINALMEAIEGSKFSVEAPQHGTAVNYDLVSQDRVIRGQMPTLDAINAEIATEFEMGMAARTRLPVRIRTGPSSQLKFSDFNSMLAPPATVCVMSLGKGPAQALLVLEPGLADALIAAALGEKRSSQAEPPSAGEQANRELTPLERRVLARLLSHFTTAMTNAWAPVLALAPEVVRFESDPRLSIIGPLNDVVVICPFEFDGPIRGIVQLALPYSAIQGAKKALVSPPRPNSPPDTRFADALLAEIEQVRVEIRAHYGQTRMKLRKVMELEIGDFVMLSTSNSSSLPLLVQGVIKLTGRPEVAHGAIAVRIDQVLDEQATPPIKESAA